MQKIKFHVVFMYKAPKDTPVIYSYRLGSLFMSVKWLKQTKRNHSFQNGAVQELNVTEKIKP